MIVQHGQTEAFDFLTSITSPEFGLPLLLVPEVVPDPREGAPGDGEES